MMPAPFATAADIADRVSRRLVSATAIVADALGKIECCDGKFNAFTDVTADRAKARAAVIDADITLGRPVGPLAGVPFAVKNLFVPGGISDSFHVLIQGKGSSE